MLTQTLRTMEESGLVERIVYHEVPPHVEYRLTVLGSTLIEPIHAIKVWAEAHIETVEAIRAERSGAPDAQNPDGARLG